MPDLHYDFIYRTEPADTDEISVSGCSYSIHGDPLSVVSIYYTNDKFPAVSIFYDEKTRIISTVYPALNYGCDTNLGVIYQQDDDNQTKTMIIQPIFKSQPKIWFVVTRKNNIIFTNNGHAYTNVTDKQLSLYTAAKVSDRNTWNHEEIMLKASLLTENIKQQTCYAIPEDQKLRPCTPEETKLRTPALKVFLGEK
jgi:hypothetical protein